MIQRLDRHGRVSAVPFQKSGVPETAGLSYEQCEAAAWAMLTDGTLSRGAGAINAALSTATRFPIFSVAYRLPVIRQVQDFTYAWVVENRSRLPGVTPYCEQFPEECD